MRAAACFFVILWSRYAMSGGLKTVRPTANPVTSGMVAAILSHCSTLNSSSPRPRTIMPGFPPLILVAVMIDSQSERRSRASIFHRLGVMWCSRSSVMARVMSVGRACVS